MKPGMQSHPEILDGNHLADPDAVKRVPRTDDFPSPAVCNLLRCNSPPVAKKEAGVEKCVLCVIAPRLILGDKVRHPSPTSRDGSICHSLCRSAKGISRGKSEETTPGP